MIRYENMLAWVFILVASRGGAGSEGYVGMVVIYKSPIRRHLRKYSLFFLNGTTKMPVR